MKFPMMILCRFILINYSNFYSNNLIFENKFIQNMKIIFTEKCDNILCIFGIQIAMIHPPRSTGRRVGEAFCLLEQSTER
jgi:hypothetical protein